MKRSLVIQLRFSIALLAIAALIGVDSKPPSRISGALDAEFGVFTWVVSIGIWSDEVYPDHNCGGAIISSRHILTAGHCVENKNTSIFSVRGGITHLHDETAVVANVSDIILYPKYSPPIYNSGSFQPVLNDIAILVLDKDLDLGGRLTKVLLPNSPLKNHQHGVVAGWGWISQHPKIVKTLTLKYADVEYLDDASCWKFIGPSQGPQSFCGIQENGNVLHGDSGSPLVSDGIVIGIVSSGSNQVHYPDFYTNVYYYRNWIDSIITDSSSAS